MIKTVIKFEKNERDRSEDGNVLFLILIAVALFAALSYAVTQSTRSSGSNSTSETALISSTQVTQYQASVRTAVLRMQVSSNVSADELVFDAPVDFSTHCDTPANSPNCVFHPDGGGATYQTATDDITSTAGQIWVYNGENQVNQIGRYSTGGNTTSNVEVIAFLANVRDGICQRINEELGISGIPTENSIEVTQQMATTDTIGLGTSGDIIGDDVTELDNQPFGCFEQGGVNYYYHVLVEQ